MSGNLNRNRQRLTTKTLETGNQPFARVWVVECMDCQHVYGVNSCDFHERRCPCCQQGAPGLELTKEG